MVVSHASIDQNVNLQKDKPLCNSGELTNPCNTSTLHVSDYDLFFEKNTSFFLISEHKVKYHMKVKYDFTILKSRSN